MPNNKAKGKPVLGVRATRKFLRALAIFIAECGPQVRAELNGILMEADEMSKDKRTWRATFKGLKPEPGKLAIGTNNIEAEIEVYAQTKERWGARYWPSGAAIAAGIAGSRLGAQAAVEALFVAKEIDWTCFNSDGSPFVEQPLPNSEATA